MRTTNDPRVDTYISRAAEFAQPILEHLRAVVHEAVPEVEESIKWSMPFFSYRGVILGNMAAFKEHASFGVWGVQGPATSNNTAEKQQGVGNFGRLTSIKDLPPKKQLLGQVREAAKLIADGTRTKSYERPRQGTRATREEPEVPAGLAAALKRNKAAAKTFAAFSPSCRREYIEWVAEAKREETREKRIAMAVEWMAEGKQRNWKYQNC